jgi:hypothetical protein
MQDQNNNNSNMNSKEFYNQSMIRNNLIHDYVNELSANETIDLNVEKVLLRDIMRIFK